MNPAPGDIGMRCIFCKAASNTCVSREHIVPESLGNTEHVLPRGWVCDKCNNYFAREVEKPFLDSLYGRCSRFEMAVANKNGRIPPASGIHAQSRTKIEMFHWGEEGGLCVGAAEGEDESAWISSLRSHTRGRLYVPTATSPDIDMVTARFIGKVALEIFAHRCIEIPGWNSEIVDKVELDELRQYVRTGNPRMIWPIHMRRIYAPDFVFAASAFGSHQVLHEWTVLRLPNSEYYVVLALFGIEYALNLGGPEKDGYVEWLKLNRNRSPLYLNECVKGALAKPHMP